MKPSSHEHGKNSTLTLSISAPDVCVMQLLGPLCVRPIGSRHNIQQHSNVAPRQTCADNYNNVECVHPIAGLTKNAVKRNGWCVVLNLDLNLDVLWLESTKVAVCSEQLKEIDKKKFVYWQIKIESKRCNPRRSIKTISGEEKHKVDSAFEAGDFATFW